MKIENLQIPKGYNKKETSKVKEPTDDFSKVLSGTITKGKESNVKEDNKVVDPNIQDTEVEDNIESINGLLMFVNMPLFEDELINIGDLGKEELVNISSDGSTVSNLLDGDIMNMVDIGLININSNEEFVLEEILLGTEILDSNSISINEIADFGKDLQDETKLDINSDSDSDNKSIDHNLKYQSNDKNLSTDNEFSPVNKIKEVNLEELFKTEDVDFTRPIDDQVLEIKKDDTIGEGKWINHNLQGTQKVNVVNEVEEQPKVISNENIQNINDSIIQLMETTREGNTNLMKVQLYPEELGAVNITLKMEDGKLIAKILVDDDYVKQLFTGKIELLSNNLAKQNINMESIFVELNNNANSNPNGNSGQNNSSFSKQNKNFEFTSESLDQRTTEEIDLKSSELSILA